MKAVRAAGWIGSVAAVVYLGVAGAALYTGSGDSLLLFAPVALGLVLRQWWAAAIPVFLLLPLPALLVVSSPDEQGEYGAAGIAFLVAYWTAIQCVLVAAGVALGRLVESRRREPRPTV